MFELKYCEVCKEDMERMELGYNPTTKECTHWQCKVLDLIQLFITILFAIPAIFIIIPAIVLLNFIENIGK